MAGSSDPQRLLRKFQKYNEFFVGIDSDGSAFDTMEVKHKECFIPNIIRYYNLAAVSKYAREAAEFINLYSQWRGINRFPALIMSFDLLIERPEVLRGHHPIPALTGLRRWVERETKLPTPRSRQKSRPRAMPTWCKHSNGARRSIARSARSSITCRRSPSSGSLSKACKAGPT